MEITWFKREDLEGTIEEFLKKYDAGELDGEKDAVLFFKAQSLATQLSKESDDEDEQEMWEDLETDLEEYTSLAYFTEIRGTDVKIVMKMTAEEQLIGTYTGEYEPFAEIKNNIWMDWISSCQLQIMKGNPNTDAQFFSGDLTVKGSLKLASKPRQWIYSFFDFIDREVD